MEVILLENTRNLGNLGDKVSVRSGYARNHLLPKGIAVMASEDNVAYFEARKAELLKAQEEKLAKAQQRAQSMESLSLTIAAKASDEGKLYGSVGTFELVEAFQKAGADVHRSEIILEDGAFRQVGEYNVALSLHSDVTVDITVNVVAE